MARVLIVCEDSATAELAMLICKRAGHQARLVANGLQALMVLDEQPYDAVIADGETARFCARALVGPVRLAVRPHGLVPIVAIVPHGNSAGPFAGIAATVPRPLREEPLLDALERVTSTYPRVEIVPLQNYDAVPDLQE